MIDGIALDIRGEAGVGVFPLVGWRMLKKLPPTPARDLILTTAFGLSMRQCAPFFRSLAKTSCSARIVVFTANLNHEERRAFKTAGAEVVHKGVHLHRIFRRPLQVLFWRVVRKWSDSGSFAPPWDRLQQANVLRWSLYRDFLTRHGEGIRRVLITDSRDVFFQSDPFADCDSSRLHVFAEEGDPTVEETRWNRDSMRKAFGPEVYDRMKSKRVSCSGVILGGLSAVRHYLDCFSRFLPELNMPDHGVDQCIHIRAIHECLKDVVFCGNREGQVCHLHHVKDTSSIPTNSSGELINADGNPFSVIHQYDRHPHFAGSIIRMYGL